MVRLMRVMAFFMILGATFLSQDAGSTREGKTDFNDGGFIEVRCIGIPAKGVEPDSAQGYTTARRAAQINCYLAVAEQVDKMSIGSNVTLENDQAIRNRVDQAITSQIKLSGAQIIKETSMSDFSNMKSTYKNVEMVMHVPMTGAGGIYNVIVPLVQPTVVKRDDSLKVFAPPVAAAPTMPVAAAQPPPRGPSPSPAQAPSATPAVATASSVPAAAAPYDALIVHVPAGFQPSLFPRILSEGNQLVYSPKDVPVEILSSTGSAQYTNNEGKAKTLLQQKFNARNPLIINAAAKGNNDAELKNDDAMKVYNSNKSNSFLSKARVVFVIS